MNQTELKHKNTEIVKSVDEMAPYVGYMNLLLFCGAVFVFGFVSLYFNSAPGGAVIFDKKEDRSSQADEKALPDELSNLKTKLQDSYAEKTSFREFSLKENGQFLEIHLGLGYVFKPGSADLAGNWESEVAELARLILSDSQNYSIEFEGHTDDVPVIKNAWKYPTNWELSASRASQIADVFARNGHITSQMKVSGRSHHSPLLPNRTPAGEAIYKNQLKNRRLVLRIGNPAY